MPSTALLSVEVALLAALKEAPALSDVLVTSTPPSQSDDEFIYLYELEATDREFKGLGPQPTPMEESIEVKLEVSVIKGPADDVTEARNRAVELAEAVENKLREGPYLGDTVTQQHISKWKLRPGTRDAQGACGILLTLSCKARI